MRRALDRLWATVLTVMMLAIPVVVIVAFWGSGGWGHHFTPAWWWWILASLCATLGIANSWTRRRERLSGAEPPYTSEDAPAALRAWWLFGETLLYLLWVGVAVALVVLGNALGRIIGAALLLACISVAARLARRRASRRL
jgi:hypothetical protein